MDKGSILFIFIIRNGFCFIFYNSIPSNIQNRVKTKALVDL